MYCPNFTAKHTHTYLWGSLTSRLLPSLVGALPPTWTHSPWALYSYMPTLKKSQPQNYSFPSLLHLQLKPGSCSETTQHYSLHKVRCQIYSLNISLKPSLCGLQGLQRTRSLTHTQWGCSAYRVVEQTLYNLPPRHQLLVERAYSCYIINDVLQSRWHCQ